MALETKQEKLIFVKPTLTDFVFVKVFEKNGKIYLDEAVFAQSAAELNQKAALCLSDAEEVRYDVSIYMQDAKNLREEIETPVYCYKPKQKQEERIAANSEWLNENLVIDEYYDDSDYRKFVELFKEYRPNMPNQNTVAADVLSDAAKHYRRIIE